MTDVHWIRLTHIDTLPLREGRPVMLAGRELAVFNLGDRVLVTDNRCPHQGGPLCDGIVTGSAVVCPLHAWKIDLDSGCVQRPSTQADAAVDTYPTRVVDGVVLVGLPPDADAVPMTSPPSCAPISEGDFRTLLQRS